MPTIIVGLILLAVVVFAIKRVRKEGSCTGCSHCSASNTCSHCATTDKKETI